MSGAFSEVCRPAPAHTPKFFNVRIFHFYFNYGSVYVSWMFSFDMTFNSIFVISRKSFWAFWAFISKNAPFMYFLMSVQWFFIFENFWANFTFMSHCGFVVIIVIMAFQMRFLRIWLVTFWTLKFYFLMNSIWKRKKYILIKNVSQKVSWTNFARDPVLQWIDYFQK